MYKHKNRLSTVRKDSLLQEVLPSLGRTKGVQHRMRNVVRIEHPSCVIYKNSFIYVQIFFLGSCPCTYIGLKDIELKNLE